MEGDYITKTMHYTIISTCFSCIMIMSKGLELALEVTVTNIASFGQ